MTRKRFLALAVIAGVLFVSMAEAQELKSSKSCGFLEHKVVVGDWISKVTKDKLGVSNDPELFRTIAELSGIKDPSRIHPGNNLVIPTCYKNAEAVAVEAKVELALALELAPSVSEESLNLPGQEVPVSFVALESQEKVVIDEILEIKAEPETIPTEVVVDAPSDATVIKTATKVTVLKEGVYKITVSSENLASVKVGVFPALVITGADDSGRWERKETVAVIKEAGENFELNIPMNKSIPVDEFSSVVFDLGGGNVTQVSAEDLAEADTVIFGKMKVVPLKEAEYAILHEGFPKKPGFVKKAFKVFVSVGVPAIVGFSAGGPVGAVYPVAQAIVRHKLEKAQRKAAAFVAQQ